MCINNYMCGLVRTVQLNRCLQNHVCRLGNHENHFGMEENSVSVTLFSKDQLLNDTENNKPKIQIAPQRLLNVIIL